ncbi:unnamed protein product [Ectocarpus sp. 6 AP-2014]
MAHTTEQAGNMSDGCETTAWALLGVSDKPSVY